MIPGGIEYPFRSVGGPTRPLLFLHIRNAHRPDNALILPALVDTGADFTVAPRHFCGILGHDFQRGERRPDVSGIGGSARVFAHDTTFSVLGPNDTPREEDSISGEFVSRMSFVDQRLQYVLLGQKDFLRSFVYLQDAVRQRFWLKPL